MVRNLLVIIAKPVDGLVTVALPMAMLEIPQPIEVILPIAQS